MYTHTHTYGQIYAKYYLEYLLPNIDTIHLKKKYKKK